MLSIGLPAIMHITLAKMLLFHHFNALAVEQFPQNGKLLRKTLSQELINLGYYSMATLKMHTGMALS